MADHMQKLFIHGPEERCKEGFIIRRELAVEKLIANPALNQRVVEIEIRRHVVTFAGLKLLLDTFENLHFLILDDVRFTPSNDSHLRIPCNGLVQKLDLCQTVLPDYVIQALPAVYSLALRCESYDTLRKDLTRHWTIDRAKFESMVVNFRGLVYVLLEQTSPDTNMLPSLKARNSCVRVVFAPPGLELSNYFTRATICTPSRPPICSSKA